MSNSHGSKKKSEGFFSIDRGAFRCAAVGGLNSAIANLILARGTGPDNVTTQWSVNAIEQSSERRQGGESSRHLEKNTRWSASDL
jgi:hypothetical protein